MDFDRMRPDLDFAPDADLVALARDGDRIAFGLLYLRHHAAAWRVASVVTGFSDDAEVAVINAFSDVFAVLPRDMDGVAVRAYLLATVRQAALDRSEATAAQPRVMPDVSIDLHDEIVVGDLGDHVVRTVLHDLPEPVRTALWLTDVEGLTPNEGGAILDLDPADVAALAGEARDHVRRRAIELHRRSPVRAGCRLTVDSLDRYLDGALTPLEHSAVKAHIDRCIACRMRRSELGDVTAALVAAVPPPPLLGGECQHRWMSSPLRDGGTRKVLPPGQAAATLHRRATRRMLSAGSAVVVVLLALVLGVSRLDTPAPADPATLLAAPLGDRDGGDGTGGASTARPPAGGGAPAGPPARSGAVIATVSATQYLPGYMSTPGADRLAERAEPPPPSPDSVPAGGASDPAPVPLLVVPVPAPVVPAEPAPAPAPTISEFPGTEPAAGDGRPGRKPTKTSAADDLPPGRGKGVVSA